MSDLTMFRRVPARTKTLTALWCKKDFTVMDQKFRDIREKMSKPMDTCHWCNHKFENGEMMALAAVKGTGNKMLCQSCAEQLLASSPPPQEGGK